MDHLGRERYLRLPASNEHEIFYLINVTKGHLEAVEGVSVKYDLSRLNALSATRSEREKEGKCTVCIYSQILHNSVHFHAVQCNFLQFNAMQCIVLYVPVQFLLACEQYFSLQHCGVAVFICI